MFFFQIDTDGVEKLLSSPRYPQSVMALIARGGREIPVYFGIPGSLMKLSDQLRAARTLEAVANIERVIAGPPEISACQWSLDRKHFGLDMCEERRGEINNFDWI